MSELHQIKALLSVLEIFKALSGFRTFGPSAYLKKGRLEDVLSLIQVLALDTDPRRSEEGIVQEIQGPPKSAELWTEIAEDHAEFFRVSKKDKCPISLVSRFVSVGSQAPREPLTQEFTHSLLTTAIEIHDRQIKRSEKWTYLIPVWVALITGFCVVIASLFTSEKNTNKETTYKVELKNVTDPNKFKGQYLEGKIVIDDKAYKIIPEPDKKPLTTNHKEKTKSQSVTNGSGVK